MERQYHRTITGHMIKVSINSMNDKGLVVICGSEQTTVSTVTRQDCYYLK